MPESTASHNPRRVEGPVQCLGRDGLSPGRAVYEGAGPPCQLGYGLGHSSARPEFAGGDRGSIPAVDDPDGDKVRDGTAAVDHLPSRRAARRQTRGTGPRPLRHRRPHLSHDRQRGFARSRGPDRYCRHVPKKAVSATADDTETGAKTAASGSDYLRIVEARHKSTVAGLVVVVVIDVAIPHPSCRESPCVPTRVTHRRRRSTVVSPQTAWGIFQRLIAPFREPEKGKSKDMARTVIDAVASGVPTALFALRRSGTCRHRLQLPLPHHLDRPIAAQNWPIQTAPACCIDKSRSAA